MATTNTLFCKSAFWRIRGSSKYKCVLFTLICFATMASAHLHTWTNKDPTVVVKSQTFSRVLKYTTDTETIKKKSPTKKHAKKKAPKKKKTTKPHTKRSPTKKPTKKTTPTRSSARTKKCDAVFSYISGGTDGIKTINQCEDNSSCRCFKCHPQPYPNCTIDMCIIINPTPPGYSNGNGGGVGIYGNNGCAGDSPNVDASGLINAYQTGCYTTNERPPPTANTPYFNTPTWNGGSCYIGSEYSNTIKTVCVPCN